MSNFLERGLSQFTNPEAPQKEIDEREVERILETREAARIEELHYGTLNKIFWVELQNDGDGIFKPKSGESSKWRGLVEDGTLFKRERAACLVDKFLDFDLVPPTVIRAFRNEIGSFQKFIPDHKAGSYFSEEDDKIHREELKKLWLFDYIIWNFDRNRQNVLLANGKIHAIDNGSSFEGASAFSRFMSYLSDSEIPEEPFAPEIIDKLKKFVEDPQKKSEMLEALTKLIGERAANACLFRIKNIAKAIIKEGCVPIDFDPQFGLEE